MFKKEKTNKKKKYKNLQTKNKGITLIALVITIIVILILAGVSINTLFGDNGLLTKADEARRANEKAGIQDRIETEVMASYGTDGKIDFDQLNNNLKARISGITHNGKSLDDNPITGLPTTVKVDGYEIEINGDTKEIAEEPFTPEQLTFNPDAEAQHAEKYGNEITAKNSSTKLENGEWKLFYQDNNYTYIIHDDLVSLNGSLESKYKEDSEKYGDGKEVGAIGQALNPMIKAQKPEMFTLNSTQDNMKGVAYLTDPDKWKEYSDKLDGALFAIGSPTIELYAASFNATCERVGKREMTFNDLVGNGYSLKLTSSGDLHTENGGIYNTGKSGCWWLASPWRNYSFYLWRVPEADGYFDQGGEDVRHTNEVRPLVCFRNSVFNELYNAGYEK